MGRIAVAAIATPYITTNIRLDAIDSLRERRHEGFIDKRGGNSIKINTIHYKLRAVHSSNHSAFDAMLYERRLHSNRRRRGVERIIIEINVKFDFSAAVFRAHVNGMLAERPARRLAQCPEQNSFRTLFSDSGFPQRIVHNGFSFSACHSNP
jgi:hypothetical protein